MKSGIHPTYYPDALVVCACGNTWTTGSTKKEIHTDVCSSCHPFYTGEQRIVDTAGQVERFMKRVSAKEQLVSEAPPKKAKRARRAPVEAPEPETPAAPKKSRAERRAELAAQRAAEAAPAPAEAPAADAATPA